MSDDSSAWDFIPLSEYRPPEAPAGETVRVRLLRLVRRIGQPKARGSAHGDAATAEWRRPSSALIEELTPQTDPRRAAEDLAAALDRRWGDSARSFVAVVGPPGAGVGAALADLASERGWPVVQPPAGVDLLESTDALEAVAAELEAARGPAVLCPLERLFLRHEAGLGPLRRLLSRLSARGGPLVVGADSWAWAYLCRATQVDELAGEPLVPRPWTGRDLDAWLGGPFRSRGVEVRPVGGEGSLFPGGGEAETAAPDPAGVPPPTAPWLDGLAARARGNPGVARVLWRRALRVRTDFATETVDVARGGSNVAFEPDLDAAEPSLPERPTQQDRLVVHALLLHAGLSRGRLVKLLPLSAAAVAGSVERLVDAGVLTESEQLEISLAAYPAVRRHLASEGFLVDGL